MHDEKQHDRVTNEIAGSSGVDGNSRTCFIFRSSSTRRRLSAGRRPSRSLRALRSGLRARAGPCRWRSRGPRGLATSTCSARGLGLGIGGGWCRARCLAKFDRLCGRGRPLPAAPAVAERPASRPRQVPHLARSQPFATAETAPVAPRAPRCVPQMMSSGGYLTGPEPLRCSERHATARRTWQLEMEMAKIAFEAAAVGPGDSTPTRRPSRAAPRPPAIVVKHVDRLEGKALAT